MIRIRSDKAKLHPDLFKRRECRKLEIGDLILFRRAEKLSCFSGKLPYFSRLRRPLNGGIAARDILSSLSEKHSFSARRGETAIEEGVETNPPPDRHPIVKRELRHFWRSGIKTETGLRWFTQLNKRRKPDKKGSYPRFALSDLIGLNPVPKTLHRSNA